MNDREAEPTRRAAPYTGRALARVLAPLDLTVWPLVRRGWTLTAAALGWLLLDAVLTGTGVGLVSLAGQLPTPGAPAVGGLGALLVVGGRLAAWALLAALPVAVAADFARSPGEAS